MGLTPGSRLGAYEIVGLIGAGGMGEVYCAWDQRLERDVALKLLPLHLTHDPVARGRLHREARAAAALDHPFICKIFEIGEHDDTLFIVMEHVVGETLHVRLASGLLTPSDALRIAGEIVEALEVAHARRIVHRDLKPGNVMLTAQARVKVMDFGLAKQLPTAEWREAATTTYIPLARPVTPLTDPGLRVGTPDYMAPEQVLGDAVDERADLFAFGILLCELLTGEHPFRRRSAGETMAAILREPPTLRSSIAGSLAALLHRLLAKAPADRFGSVADVRRDLNGLASSLGSTTGVLVPELPTARTMVGRDGEHKELRRRLEDTIAGHGSIVLVGGEPGIGKTRLTQALLSDARQRGCFAVVGQCYEAEGAPPYIPFVETLEYSARVVPPSVFRRALGDAAPEVAKLMPELRQLFPDIPSAIQLPPEQQRRFLFNAYREFLERCCGLSPLVVVLEDLHWADEPTLQLLHHLAQTVPSRSMLIVGTYRDVELDVHRPFARTLETLLRARRASRIALHRLPAPGVESMLRTLSGQPPPSALVRLVFQETEGNPFFVEEVFHHLEEDGHLFDANGSWRSDLRMDTLQVPEGIRLVIGRRLERLSETARRVLTTAAVIGRTFSVAVLEALESTQPDAVLDGLEEAARAQLVTSESGEREPRFRFTHELIRQTLAESLLLPRRQRLHARIAEAIERVYAASVGKQASPLAHHLFHAGAAADAEKTIRHLMLAADQAKAAAAHEESLELLDRALSLCDGEGGSRVADLHARRAGALRSLARTAETIEGYRHAIALFDGDGNAEQAAVARNVLALLHIWNWHFDDGLRLLDQGLARPDAVTPATQCMLFVSRALGLGGSGDLDGAFAARTQAQDLQRTLGDDDLDILTSSVEVHLRLHAMHIDRAVEIAGEVTQRTRALGDAWAEAEMSFVEPLAALYRGRLDEFRRLTAERLPRAERLGHWNVVWFFKMFLPFDALYRGAFEESEQRSRDCMAFGEDLQTALRYTGRLYLGLSYALRGQSDEGIAHLRAATDNEVTSFASGAAPTLLAWVLAQEGDPCRALDVLSTYPPRLPDTRAIPPLGAWNALGNLIPTLALAAPHEHVAPLHPWAEQLVTMNVCTYGSPVLFSTSAGIAAAHANQWTRAEAHHQRAIQQADDGYRICQPDARVWYADMLLARGEDDDRNRARALLAEALALYESIGMPDFARRTSARLATMQ